MYGYGGVRLICRERDWRRVTSSERQEKLLISPGALQRLESMAAVQSSLGKANFGWGRGLGRGL